MRKFILCKDEDSAHVQISQTYNEPTIVLMAWPPAQQLAGVLSGTNGVNETANYVQALSSLYTQVTLLPAFIYLLTIGDLWQNRQPFSALLHSHCKPYKDND